MLFTFRLFVIVGVVSRGVVVIVIGVRFFLSCACRRVPVSRGARSGFKNRHTPFFFVCVCKEDREKHTERGESFFRSPGGQGTLFFFSNNARA